MTDPTTTTTTAAAVVTTTTGLPPAAPGLVAGRVTVVGDSVTIDAAPALDALIPGCEVEADVGEQWSTGISVIEQLRATGQLGDEVVVALGTNGPVTAPMFSDMMLALVGVRRVVVVTDHAPDSWEEANNSLFKAEAPQFSTVRIADWDALAKANPGWFYSDGTHMPIGGAGAVAWAKLVRSEL